MKFLANLKKNPVSFFFLVMILSVGVLYAQEEIGGPYTVDNNTMLLMHFENNLDNVSTLSADGKVHGNLTYVDNTVTGFGKCLQIDNDAAEDLSYVTVADTAALDLTGDWTIEGWFNMASTDLYWNSYPRLVAKRGDTWYMPNFYINLFAGGRKILSGFRGTSAWPEVTAPDNSLTLGEWLHVTYMRDSTKCLNIQMIHNAAKELIYFNYKQYDSGQNPPLVNGQSVSIGFGGGGADSYLNGSVDEIRISNIVRDFTMPPILINVTQLENQPATETHYDISAEVYSSNMSTGTVSLYYDVGSGFQELAMAPMGDDVYSESIPGQSPGTTVKYYVKAVDTDGLSFTQPQNAETDEVYYTFGIYTTVNITFQADMTQLLQDGFDPNIHALELRGSFNSWSDGDTLLPDAVNESIYVITKEIAGTTGDLIEWKFKANPDAYFANNGWEIGSNRILSIPVSDTVLAPVAPNIIYVMPLSQDVTVTFSVNMKDAASYQTGEPFENLQSVFLNGGFCSGKGWCGWTLDDTTNLIRLYDDGTNGGDVTANDSVWTTEVQFYAGDAGAYCYKYGAYDPDNMNLSSPVPMDNEECWGYSHSINIDDSSPLYIPPTDTWATTGEVGIPISEARGMNDGEVVTICGIVTSPNFGTPGTRTEYAVQDTSAGIILYSGSFDVDIAVGDKVMITGELSTYNGKKEIVPENVSDVITLSSGNELPAFQELTISQILSDPESYESELVKISNVTIVDGTWPESGNNANLIITDNPGDSLIMRIDKETDVDEGTEPTVSFDVQGVIGQYDSEPYNDGYQIYPRFYSDIITGEGPISTVTFLADMTQLLQDGFDPNIHALELRGSFNSWSAGDTLLPDAVNESIYVITKEITGTTGDLIEWKFKAGPDADFANNGWEIGSNRNFAIPTTDTVLAPVAPNIIYGMPLSQDVTVTFSVNMTYAVSFQTGEPFENLQSVFLNGGFCSGKGWCGWTLDDTTNLIRLYDDGTNGGDVTADDSVWTTEVQFYAGDAKMHSYKYGAYDPNNMDLQNPTPMDNEAGWGNDHSVTIDDSSPLYIPQTDTWTTTGGVGIPISEARGMADGEVVTICGIVTSPNFGTPGTRTEYAVQDTSAGIILYSGSFDVDIAVGDKVMITGELATYNGIKDIIPEVSTDVTIISSENELPAFQELTISQILSDPESYESELVKISNVTIVSGAWPESGNNANLTITDNPGDSLIMRIDKETDVDEGTEPTGSFDVQGVIRQYDSSEPYNNGYQIFPRFFSDIITGEGPELSHFQLVYTGNPYLAMNIYVTSATVYGETLNEGDEVGIFDGEYCVGAGIVTGTIDPYLALVASTDDPGTTEIDGFTPGHEITYKLWDSDLLVELTDITPNYTVGDGTFSSQGTAMVDLIENKYFSPVYTGNPYLAMNIYVTGATIDGIALSAGDEIGIFDGEYCVGAGWVTGDIDPYLALVASTDDPGTTEIDGFTPGHEITYRLWDSGEELEISNVATTYTMGDGTFSSQGTAMVSLEGLMTVGQDIGLNTGWNIMSFYAEPEDMNLQSIVQPLIDNSSLLKIQDETGSAIEELPLIGWINNIGDMSASEGYYIKVNSNQVLALEGNPVDLPIDITLDAGWNIMGYPVASAQGAMNALQPLIDAGDLLKVQDETGAAIEELPVIGWVNNIGNFEPDEGYYVKVSSSTSITLDEPSKLSRIAVVSESENRPTHFVTSFEGNPYLAMNIYVMNATLDDISLKEGTEIGVFDGELCVGTAILTRSLESNDSYLSIIVSTDDPLTKEVDGFIAGSSVSFRLWDDKDEYTMSATTCSDEEDLKALRFESQGTIVVKLTGKTLPKEYRLYACYPNPFNPTTTIRYDLPNDSHVKLVVYDLQGRLIRTLISEQKEAGYQSVIWNGKNDNGRMLPSGMYFYQLSAGNFSQVKKMALVK